jgi:hypothetical protein
MRNTPKPGNIKSTLPGRNNYFNSFWRVTTGSSDALIEFDSVNGSELSAAKKHFYLAGIKDALRIFTVS